MKFSLKQDFPYSLEKVLEARDKRWDNLDKFPELKNQQLLEEKTEDDILHQKRRLDFGTQVPSIVKTALPNGMLELIEDSQFNTQSKVHSFTVYPKGMEKKFMIKGKTNYVAVDDQSSRREYEIEIKVNVPVIGGTIESQVAKQYKNSIIKDHKKLMDFIKETS